MVGENLDALYNIYCILRPLPEEPPRISDMPYIFPETRIIGLHFAADIGVVYASIFVEIIFFWWAP